jgi:hypothetical protein
MTSSSVIGMVTSRWQAGSVRGKRRGLETSVGDWTAWGAAGRETAALGSKTHDCSS